MNKMGMFNLLKLMLK